MSLLEYRRWDAWFKVPDLTIAGATIKVYSVDPAPLYRDGAVEYCLVLNQKPAKNTVTIPVTSLNLQAGPVQRPLTQEEDAKQYHVLTETEAWRDGVRMLHRPEEVIGSIPLYHATKSSNQYMGGKLGDIYPPVLIDKNGLRVKANQALDLKAGQWTLTFPQAYLNGAAYPVTVDPLFGYSTQGGSSQRLGNRICGSWFAADGTGTADDITFWYYEDSMNALGTCGINLLADSTLVGQTIEKALGSGSPAQNVFVFNAPKPTVTNGVNYVLSAWGEDSPNRAGYIYYTAETGTGRYQTLTYTGTYPGTASFTTENRKYSIWCDYTPSAAGQQLFTLINEMGY